MISSGKRKEPAGVWTAVVVNGQTPGFWEYFSPDEKQTDMVSDRLENFEKYKCKAEFCMHFEQIKKVKQNIPSIVHLNLLQGFVNKFKTYFTKCSLPSKFHI